MNDEMLDKDNEVAQAVVIDIGSSMLKAGFVGDDAPRLSIPTVIGKPEFSAKTVDAAQQFLVVGDEALARHAGSQVQISYPVLNGRVVSWDDFEQLLHYVFFSGLNINPKKCSVFLAVAPFTSGSELVKITQMLFDSFGCPACYLGSQAFMSLYASGRTTGVVVDIGGSVTCIAAIQDQTLMFNASDYLQIGGSDLTKFMQHLLLQNGYEISDEKIVKEIKEKLCYVSQDCNEEIKSSMNETAIDRSYELPGSNIITLNQQRFVCPEALFQPLMMGKSIDGIPVKVCDAIMKCDLSIRKDLMSNIVLAGGSSMFYGIGDRFDKEIRKLAPPELKVNIIVPPERKYSSWIGGSIFASLSKFSSSWVTKAEYDKEGISVVRRKFTDFPVAG